MLRLSFFDISLRSALIFQRERAKTIEQEYRRKVESVATEGRKTADVLSDGAIVGLGLIRQKEQENKDKS
jgi:hypothetical protein